MLFSSRWCPLDDLTASTLLINISRIIFLHFQGDWHCQLKPTMSQIHRPIWLFQAQTLTSNPSQLLAPAVFNIWSEGFSQPHQVLWAGILNLIQFKVFPHPSHSSKLKPSLLIPNSIFFKAVSPGHPIQSQPCWSTFPELSFNIYKVTGINIITFVITTKCNTCINVLNMQ